MRAMSPRSMPRQKSTRRRWMACSSRRRWSCSSLAIAPSSHGRTRGHDRRGGVAMTEPGALAGGHLDIEGCFNVRDAGGWPTADGRWMRTGVLYRADDPIRITPAGRRIIDGLRLAAVVDLRQQSQFDRAPGFADPAVTHHIPLVDKVINTDEPPRIEQPGDIAQLYHDMAERGAGQIVRAVEICAEHVGSGPVMVHCAAGKDRTGMLVAIIQAAIGVGFDEIVEEYALSDIPSRARREALVAEPLP